MFTKWSFAEYKTDTVVISCVTLGKLLKNPLCALDSSHGKYLFQFWNILFKKVSQVQCVNLNTRSNIELWGKCFLRPLPQIKVTQYSNNKETNQQQQQQQQ